MPKATVAQPFTWRVGHTTVLVKKGEQDLTPDQLAHAQKHGFLKMPAPAKKNTPAPEVPAHEQP